MPEAKPTTDQPEDQQAPPAPPETPPAASTKTVRVGGDGIGDDGVDYGVALAGATVTVAA